MSATAVDAACVCGSLLPDPVQCPIHFGIYRNGKRLTSVGRIVALYPQEPCSRCHWPIYSDHQQGCSVKANIDNANRRGKLVEALLTQYVKGETPMIPAGEYESGFIDKATALFHKAADWFDKQNFRKIECQAVVGDDDTCGVIDFRCDEQIIDLKCTYDISETHFLQVGGYCVLAPPDAAALLHVTERYKAVRFSAVLQPDMDDFRALRDAYRMLERRGAFKKEVRS